MDRDDQLAAAEREEERRRLEHEIAVCVCRERIKSMVPKYTREADGSLRWMGWYYASSASVLGLDDPFLRYLDLCGLLERREGEPDVVRVRGNV